MSIRLLVADDHDVVRTGIVSLLSESDIEIVALASTGGEAVELTQKLTPDLVLLDVRMPGGDGLTALGRIKLDFPHLPILMLSNYDNPTYVARAVALGASGYLLKDMPRADLIDAIHRAHKGESLWTRDELRRVTGALAAPRLGVESEVPLTQREAEVLKLITTGQTNRQIAETMGISYETVKEHVQNMLRKIGVSDRTQAAVWAVRNGLV